MGVTSISANMDDKVIYCYYYRDIDLGESVAPVDLSISVKHQYVTTTNTAQEIVLEQFVVPKDYLETKGLLGVSAVEQTVEFHVLNLRYLDSIFIEIQEVRDGIPVFTRVPVLDSSEENDPPLTTNPERYVEHDENIPEVIPDRNISIEKMDIGILYSLKETDLVLSQASKRIYLVEENGEQYFKQQEYNEQVNKLFIENSITNLLPNPQFLGSTDIPDSWGIDAPGITFNSYLLDGPLSETKIWRIRASNTNVFNAFNSVTLKILNKRDLYSGSTALTFSVYYILKCDVSDIPFNNWTVKFNFYFNNDFIRSEELTSPVSSELNVYKLLAFTLQDIPLSANKYTVELTVDNIDSTDLFDISFYLPQLEALPCATTRTLDNRVEDRYVTGKIFQLNLPFYIWCKTHHITGPGIRGLFSSTTNQVNGFEFLSSNDRLRFKLYDTSGNIQLNVASAIIPLIHANDIVEYGLWVTATLIEFYINGGLLSSHPNTLSIDQNQYYIVGSLEKSNTTINSELMDFNIFRNRY